MTLLKKIKQKFAIENPQHIVLRAPVTGEIVPISQVPDAVFSGELLGRGIAINPESGMVVAPFAGIVTRIFPSNHAFGMVLKSGIEIFVHVGVDTVDLGGQGFQRFVHEGDIVTQGQSILEVDLDWLRKHDYSTLTSMIITDMSDIHHIEKHQGTVSAGEHDVMTLHFY